MKHKIPVALAVITITLFTGPEPLRIFADGILAPDQGGCASTVLPSTNATSANARCPSTKYAGSRAVYLILASELAANGYASGQTPGSVGWVYTATPPGISGSAPLKIYLQNTTDTTYTKGSSFAAAIASMTKVHDATTTLPGTAGPFDITLVGGSPFTYTGGGLYVAYDWGNYTGTLSTVDQIISCNNAVAASLQGANAQIDGLSASAFRPETRLGSTTQHDNALAEVYSYGELPQGLVPAQQIKAAIANKGALAQTNVPVTLNVTGSDTFTNMQTVASMAACTGTGNVTFAGFTPAAIGSDTITASVPADDVNTNNSKSHPLNITSLSYSYKYPGTTSSGGAGFTGATGAVVAKFTLTAANAVTDVKLEFFGASATTYRVAIYPDSGFGNPSTTASYTDAADRTVAAAGPVTIHLASPVAVAAGNFYVGMHQTNTTNSNFAFDNESPIRAASFYAASLPVTSWTDFSPGTTFKLNIGVLLQTPGGALSVSSAASRKTHGGAGNQDINLPTTGTTGVECRNGGATNDFTMIVTFSANVTVSGSPQAQVTSGTGTIGSGGVSNGGAVTVAGNVVTIPLTNVADQQTINVTLNGVNAAFDSADVPAVNFVIPMSRLLGDTNGNRAVNASDVTQTKGRIGQAVTSANFRSDVNANGSINAGDASLAKANSGHAVP